MGGQHAKRRAGRVSALVVAGLVAGGGLVTVGVGNAEEALVAGTPCTVTARACVDLTGKKAWLVTDGAVTRGPVPASPGGPDKATPAGTFAVDWKDNDHHSAEFDNAPMPWAVFFAPGGIAFHEGNVNTPSAGCVRLGAEDAKEFYRVLQVGDEVQVR